MRQVGSNYVVHEMLGVGTSGGVWRGSTIDGERPVAIKLMHPALALDPGFAERFLGGREAVVAVRSPHLVSVRDLLVDDELLAVVMDLVEGPDLRGWVRRNGRPTEQTALDLVQDLLAALSALHQAGIVHGDLKPENVLVVCGTGEGARALLTDFGIAQLELGPSVTADGRIIGSPDYLAPELAAGHARSPASDLYSLGVLAYELLAGRPPFEATSPRQLIHEHAEQDPAPIAGVEPNTWDVVASLLAKDPQRRPGSAEEASRLLRQAREPQVGTPDPAGVVQPEHVTIPKFFAIPEPPGLTPRHANPAAPPPERPRGVSAVSVACSLALAGSLLGFVVWQNAAARDGGSEAAALRPAPTIAAPVAPPTTPDETSGSAPQLAPTTSPAHSSPASPSQPPAKRAPWRDLQAMADTWSSVVSARPDGVGAEGQSCREQKVISPYSTGKLVCRFPGQPLLVILSFASPADREKRIKVEAAKASSEVSAFRIDARPESAAGTRVLFTGGDPVDMPWLWWAYDGQEHYAMFSSWDGHSLSELEAWWEAFPPL